MHFVLFIYFTRRIVVWERKCRKITTDDVLENKYGKMNITL